MPSLKQFGMVTYCGLGSCFREFWHILSRIPIYLKAHKASSSAITDLGAADIWKLSHSAEQDYTFFSSPHNSYFQADF